MIIVDEREVFTYAMNWLREAGEKIKRSLAQPLTIEEKSNPNDLVTNIDKEIEYFFVKKIKEKFPSHRVLGEEGKGDEINNLEGIVWIIDPIDGTTNFIYQQMNFAISLGIYENGVGKIGFIYDVIHNELFYSRKNYGAFLNGKRLPKLKTISVDKAILGINATWITENRRIHPNILSSLVRDVRSTRSYGSAALEMAYVATGRLDAYISLRLSPWDIAGGKILLEEVGGTIRSLRGQEIDLLKETSLIVAKPGLYEEIFTKYLHSGKW